MITEIGIVAGEIWQLLESSGLMSLRDINSRLERPEYLILMSLGWLAREGHIVVDVDKEGKEFKIQLRNR